MRLDIYTHHFAVTEITAFDLPKIYEFLLPLVQKGLVKQRGRFKQVPLRTYAARFQNRGMFRFHVNQYFEFMEQLRRRGYQDNDFTIVDNRDTKFNAAKVKFITKNLPKPYENQEKIIQYVLEPGISKMVTLQTGKGKAICNRTPIITDKGVKPMGAMQPGWRVLCPTGQWTTVKAVYPQSGLSTMFKLTWVDGRESIACKDHQWTIHNGINNTIVTTQDLVNDYKDLNVTIPLTMPLTTGTRTSGPVPAWLYAVMHNCAYIGKDKIELRVMYKHVTLIETLSAGSPYELTRQPNGRYLLTMGGKYPTELCRALQDHYGITKLTSLDSWSIPTDFEYLTAQERITFLQLSLGTHYNPDGTYHTYSRQGTSNTVEMLKRLIWSIGGIAYIEDGMLRYNYQAAHSCIHPESDLPHVHGLELKSIVPVEPRAATCIEVTDPTAMFLTQDYVTTHNTMIAMTCAQRLGTRTIVIVKGGFLEKWHGDLSNAFELEEGGLLLVRGSADLAKLLKDAAHRRPKLNPSVILISTRTLANYFKLYEMSNGKDKGVIVPPHEILPKLKIGFRVMDEVHLEFHFVYRMDLYSHVIKSLSLSATLVSRDDFINKVHEIAYPESTRNDGGGYHAYSDATCMIYRIRRPDLVKCVGAQGYSHHMLEEWILGNADRKKTYLAMIRHTMMEYFIKIRKEGQSYLIFASSVDMCDAIKEDIELHFGTFDVGRYCGSQGDDYEDCFMKPDIVISTLGSAGAAVDKPGLVGTCLTIAVDSIQSVLQLMGRTRELKGHPGMNPSLVYFSSKDIPKHEEYRLNKVKLFKGRVLSHSMVDSNFIL